MKKLFILPLLLLVLLTACEDQETKYAKGYKAFKENKYGEAFEIFKPLAKRGHAESQYRLALLHYTGLSIPQNYDEALKWFHKSAEQGHAGAQYFLGRMYYEGQSVSQNSLEAIRWHLKAAKQGNASSQHNLAFIYDLGGFLANDLVKAYMWAIVANANKKSIGDTRLKDISFKMPQSDVKKAEELARQCIESNYENCGE